MKNTNSAVFSAATISIAIRKYMPFAPTLRPDCVHARLSPGTIVLKGGHMRRAIYHLLVPPASVSPLNDSVSLAPFHAEFSKFSREPCVP